MKGVEAYKALKRATLNLAERSAFAVNTLDALDLQKLEPSELVSLDFDSARAEFVCSALEKGSIKELGDAMGLNLTQSSDAARLRP